MFGKSPGKGEANAKLQDGFWARWRAVVLL